MCIKKTIYAVKYLFFIKNWIYVTRGNKCKKQNTNGHCNENENSFFFYLRFSRHSRSVGENLRQGHDAIKINQKKSKWK